jgi:hypothetical protein
MSGILRRTALMSHHKNGVYDFGWRRVVTGLGSMVEPSPFAANSAPSTSTTDQVYGDMIGHVNDVEYLPFGDWNALSGTPGDVRGGAKGNVHGGTGLTFRN